MNPRTPLALVLLALVACASDAGSPHSSMPVAPSRSEKTDSSTPVKTTAAKPLISPFEITLAGRTKFAAGREGFDPALPGYHLVADIGTINVSPRKVDASDKARIAETLVLRIATSPGMPPMLEGFTITSERGTLQTFLSKEGKPADTEIRGKDGKTQIVASPRYVEMKVVGKEVEVRLLPPALDWLKNGGTIQWVDWYRG